MKVDGVQSKGQLISLPQYFTDGSIHHGGVRVRSIQSYLDTIDLVLHVGMEGEGRGTDCGQLAT